MKQHQEILTVASRGRGLWDLSEDVSRVVSRAAVRTGVCLVFIRHTSASLVIQENADPTARADLLAWFERLAPDGDPAYRHDAEGPDDMPSHLRAAVTRTSETIPVVDGRLGLGTWQGLYLFEHRLRGSRRELVVQVWGE